MKTITFFISIIFVINIQTSYGQELKIKDQTIVFGSSDKDFTTSLWQQGNQIESNYKYITIYEYSDNTLTLNGLYYNAKLIGLYVGVNTNEPYPVQKEIDDIISKLIPYNELDDAVNGLPVNSSYYKTIHFYIQVNRSRMNNEYTIYPIEMINEIRKLHPEFAKDFF